MARNWLSGRRGRWAGALAAGAVVTGAAAWWLAGPARAAKGPPRGPAPVAVVVERVLQRDFPEVATGIGRVQPLQSAVVRPQIDGLLAEVHFKEGQPVKEGQLLARLDDRTLAADLAQVRATRASNLAQLETAKLDLVRYTNLLAGEAIARQRVDQQRAQVQQLEAALAASDAAIAAAEARLSFTRITAPLSGRAGLRRVDRGNFVRASDAQGLVTITQVDPVAVLFSLPQDLLPQLTAALASPEGAAVKAFDRSGGALLGQGRLLTIDNQVDDASGTIAAKAELPNQDGKLWAGQFATVELQLRLHPGATVAPSRAIRTGPQGPFAFRVDGGTAKVVPVKVLRESGPLTAVTEGLSPGDTVVVDGHSRLVDGSPVKVVTQGPQAPAPEARP